MKGDSNKVIDADNEAWIELRDDIDDEPFLEEIQDSEAMFEEISDGEYMYQKATRQCKVLRPALQNPECSEETRNALISIIKNILNSFQNTDEIKKRKEQIYWENPDFFPKESDLITAKMKLKPHLENLKSDIKKQRSQKIKPEDRISGVIAGDRLADGIRMGIIDEPKSIQSANRQANQIRKRLGLRLERK